MTETNQAAPSVGGGEDPPLRVWLSGLRSDYPYAAWRTPGGSNPEYVRADVHAAVVEALRSVEDCDADDWYKPLVRIRLQRAARAALSALASKEETGNG